MIPTSKFINDLKRAGGMTKVKLRRLKGLKWKYPLSLERQYAAAINRFMSKRWKEYSKIAVPMMVPRVDALQDLEPVPGTNGPALGAIVSVSKSLSEFNRRELNAFKKIAIGEVFAEDEPWLKNVLDEWSREQVTLITKATQDMLDTVARRIRDGVKVGKSAKEVTALINADLPGISYRRARIIARDQTAKLNSSLTQGRMTDAGLETYVWDTAQDERVRGDPSGLYPKALPSHFVMQGKICRWDDPTVWLENGEWVKRAGDAPYFHPGMAIMCRCVAVPNWNELEGVEGSDLPAVPEEVEPPAVTEPEPIAERADVGIFADEKTFVDALKSRFEAVKSFNKNWLKDAYNRFSSLSPEIRLVYSKTFTEFITEIKKGGKSRYNTALRYIEVPGYFKKGQEKSASALLHEMAHAIDARLGKSQRFFLTHGTFMKNPKFGNRNLAEIVKDELVTPIIEKARAERPETIKSILKGVSKETRTALSSALAEPSSGRYEWAVAIVRSTKDEKVKIIQNVLYNSYAPKEIWAAFAEGNNRTVLDYVLENLNYGANKAQIVAIDKMTPAMRELIELTKGAGDEMAIYGSISDMFEGATRRPGIFGTVGHGSEYWGIDNDKACGEAFAEILEIMGSTSPKKDYILDKYLPTARDFVVDAIKEASNI